MNLFNINIYGPLSINGYNALILTGLIVYFYLTSSNKLLNKLISTQDFLDLVTQTAIVGIISSRLLYIVTEDSCMSFIDMISIWDGGLSVLGAIIGGFFYAIGFLFYKDIPIMPVLDLSFIYLPFINAFGRIGCFNAGCCYGINTNFFHKLGLTEHPTQLYSSAIYVLIFFILYLIFKINKLNTPGLIVISYLVLSSIERIIVDFLRADRTFSYGINLLSVNQIIAIIILFSSIPIGLLYTKISK